MCPLCINKSSGGTSLPSFDCTVLLRSHIFKTDSELDTKTDGWVGCHSTLKTSPPHLSDVTLEWVFLISQIPIVLSDDAVANRYSFWGWKAMQFTSSSCPLKFITGEDVLQSFLCFALTGSIVNENHDTYIIT